MVLTTETIQAILKVKRENESVTPKQIILEYGLSDAQEYALRCTGYCVGIQQVKERLGMVFSNMDTYRIERIMRGSLI